MPDPDAIVIVVDDDESFRRSTERLIRSAGFKVQSFGAATEFLKAERPNAHACVVLDVRMPGLSGLDLQKELARTGIGIPIIFITGHGDIPMSVQAMKAGAVGSSPNRFVSRICSMPSRRLSSATAPHARCARNWRTCARITTRSRRASEK
jgi:FixJ family two-component response regulator